MIDHNIRFLLTDSELDKTVPRNWFDQFRGYPQNKFLCSDSDELNLLQLVMIRRDSFLHFANDIGNVIDEFIEWGVSDEIINVLNNANLLDVTATDDQVQWMQPALLFQSSRRALENILSQHQNFVSMPRSRHILKSIVCQALLFNHLFPLGSTIREDMLNSLQFPPEISRLPSMQEIDANTYDLEDVVNVIKVCIAAKMHTPNNVPPGLENYEPLQ